MKKFSKIFFILSFLVTLNVMYSYAQEVIVRTRPARPHYVRVEAPSPRHVWIEEEWEPRDGAYFFVGGRWAEPPREGMVWIPGHWARRQRGEIWIQGHWRERRR